MKENGRGWNMGSRCKPAAEYEIRYGWDLLKEESAVWPACAAVSTPSAWKAAQAHFSRPPEGVVFAEWLDSGHQQELSDALPPDVELVVGLGGGRAVDAAKFAALDKGASLIQVPTIVSSGAIIHGHVARWEGRQTVGGVDDWPWVDCECVLVDYGLVLQAPYYLNTAGLGDILCTYAGLAEWRRRAEEGRGPVFDEQARDGVVAYHEELTLGFEATLDGEGGLTAQSVRHIMTCLQERDDRALRRRGAGGGDHPFWIALETANDRSWVHGELVALGALIITWCCGDDVVGLTERLDRCRVRYRPSQMGLRREQLQRGLEYAPRYMEERDVDSVLRFEPVQGKRFAALWDFLEGPGGD